MFISFLLNLSRLIRVLMNPKTYDSVPPDLLIAKMHAGGFSTDSLIFFYFYPKRLEQNVKIINTNSVFQILLSRFPQG